MFRNPRQHHRLIGGCDRITIGSREQRGFFVGDIVERAETFAVLEIDVKDHRDVGLDDLRELRNFAARVGAAFEDGRAMLAGECENSHRHADQIVQIAWCRERGSEHRANDGSGEFLGGGLADCAADCDERKRARCTRPHEMTLREQAKRGESIVNLDAIESRMTPASLDDRGYRATRGGLWQIVVAVDAVATKRDEY